MSAVIESMVGHVEGPWRYDPSIHVVFDRQGHMVARIGNTNFPEADAKAWLITAAPDGLAAAKFALSVLEANPIEASERLAIEKLRDFIAKAEGTSR